jgi:hypothetical protein
MVMKDNLFLTQFTVRCCRKFKIDKLAVHLKYFCGEMAQRTEAQSRQRRTADRHQRPAHSNNRVGGGSQGAKDGKKTFKSKHSKLTKTKKPLLKAAAKTTVRARGSKNYDSDSDLSVPENLDVSSGRPSRSAATQALKQMNESSKEWSDGGASDSDAFSGSDASSDESNSDDKSVAPKTATFVSRRKVEGEVPSDSSSSESEDDAVLARARKRQRVAMSQIKKASRTTKKNFKTPAKGMSTGKKITARKKKMPDEDSSSSDSNDDSFKDDPLASVDMDALKTEALQGCAVSPLHTMSFWRVVLDEAHMIKSRSSQTASAAFHLSSAHRWALSGTPLQNRVGEFYSLIRFLRLDPMAHYFCRCNVSREEYRIVAHFLLLLSSQLFSFCFLVNAFRDVIAKAFTTEWNTGSAWTVVTHPASTFHILTNTF